MLLVSFDKAYYIQWGYKTEEVLVVMGQLQGRVLTSKHIERSMESRKGASTKTNNGGNFD